MYIEYIKSHYKGKVYSTPLLRISYKEKGKVKHRTIANMSSLPKDTIEEMRKLLGSKGQGKVITKDSIKTVSSKEYGASVAVIKTAKGLGLDRIIHREAGQWREDVMAMIAGRVVYQGSKLSLTNLYKDTGLWQLCGHGCDERPDVETHCYKPLDKLLARQEQIQRLLAQRHLSNGCLVLYDITSSYLEGEYMNSELVAFGKNRDNKKGHEQIAIGLITNGDGCPVAIEVFKGNTQDQSTVYKQVSRIAEDFGVKEVVFAGDRGMLTPKRIAEVKEREFKTITALTHPQVMNLLEKGVIQLGLFDEKNIAEVIDPDDPSVRYMLCKNPQTQEDETQTRQELINKAIAGLSKLTGNKRRSDKQLSAAAGKVFGKYPVEKFFEWEVKDMKLSYRVNNDLVEREKALDGCYIIRTDVSASSMKKNEVVDSYRRLAHVEKAFRYLKTVALEIRPIYHKIDTRIRAHVFLCMLAYYVQWHMTQRLQPLFNSDGKGKKRRWSFPIVLKRLSSLRLEKRAINQCFFEHTTTPDEEQEMILSLLKVSFP